MGKGTRHGIGTEQGQGQLGTSQKIMWWYNYTEQCCNSDLAGVRIHQVCLWMSQKYSSSGVQCRTCMFTLFVVQEIWQTLFFLPGKNKVMSTRLSIQTGYGLHDTICLHTDHCSADGVFFFQKMMSEQERLSAFMKDPTLNQRQKTGPLIDVAYVPRYYNLSTLFFCLATMKDVLGALKYSDVMVNLFSKYTLVLVCLL